MKVLFVTWDSGATDYLSSLFFPIFAALRARGVHVYTLQGTYGDAEDVARVAASAARYQLGYRAMRVSKVGRKAGMPLHLVRFSAEIVRKAKAVGAKIVMPRAIVPAAACLLARPLLPDVEWVWDADGLPADERVDFAGWSPWGVPYWGMRGAERLMFQVSSRVMVRTQQAAEILQQRGGRSDDASRIFVVPNGRDEVAFTRDMSARQALRAELGLDEKTPLLISVGTQGPQYLTELQLRIVQAFTKVWPTTRAVFLTAQDELVHRTRASLDIAASTVIARRVPAHEIPQWLSAADVGLALRAPAFSQRAVCPLKVAEYLLTSLPVITTPGIGDLDQVLDSDCAFFMRANPSELELDELVRWYRAVAASPASTGARAREVGLQYFSLNAAVSSYCTLFGVD